MEERIEAELVEVRQPGAAREHRTDGHVRVPEGAVFGVDLAIGEDLAEPLQPRPARKKRPKSSSPAYAVGGSSVNSISIGLSTRPRRASLP